LLNVLVHIFFAVVYGDFITGFKSLQRPDPDSFAGGIALGVRAARMIDVACKVAAGAAVNSTFLIKLKQVLPAFSITLFGTDDGANVLYDFLISRDGLESE
jgi:hypothetical protein